jgi:tetratricopeptide (TPR) repeat protein
VAHLITAQTQLLQARTEDALLHLDQALALDPDYGDARFRRGLVLADAGRMGAVHDWLVFHGNARAKDRARDAFLASRVRLLYEARGLPVPPLLAEKK